MSVRNLSSGVMWFAAGLGFGAAGALLLAPKTGRETRKSITKTAATGRDYIVGKGRRVAEHAEEIRETAADLAGKGKERLAEVLEAGKRYRTRLAG